MKITEQIRNTYYFLEFNKYTPIYLERSFLEYVVLKDNIKFPFYLFEIPEIYERIL